MMALQKLLRRQFKKYNILIVNNAGDYLSCFNTQPKAYLSYLENAGERFRAQFDEMTTGVSPPGKQFYFVANVMDMSWGALNKNECCGYWESDGAGEEGGDDSDLCAGAMAKPVAAMAGGEDFAMTYILAAREREEIWEELDKGAGRGIRQEAIDRILAADLDVDGPIIVGDGGCCKLCGIALTEDDMQESLERKQRICESCVDEGNEKLTEVQTALAESLIFHLVEKYPSLLEGLLNCKGDTRVDAMKVKDVMFKCIAQVKIDAPQMLEQILAVPAEILMEAAWKYTIDQLRGGVGAGDRYTIDQHGNIETKKTPRKDQWPTHAEKRTLNKGSATATAKSKEQIAVIKKKHSSSMAGAHEKAVKEQEELELALAKKDALKKEKEKETRAKFEAFVTDDISHASQPPSTEPAMTEAEAREFENTVSRLFLKDALNAKQLGQRGGARGGGKKKKK